MRLTPSKRPSISVIIPVKNDLSGIQLMLDSLRRQSVAHELIVVDNGSTDGTREFLESQGVRVLHFPGLRVGALRNRGVEVSSGDCTVFADSDHEVGEDWLEKGMEVLMSDPQVAACGSHYLPPENSTWVQRTWAIHRLRKSRTQEVDWLASGNLFVRRDRFVEVGGFNENLVAAEDVDLCHRLRSKGGRILHDARIASVHHGEAPTLNRFFRKEWWRGSSGFRAWISQGFPAREVLSLIWPLWHLLLPLGGLLGSVGLIWSGQYSMACIAGLISMLFWCLPAVLLGSKVGYRHGFSVVLHLSILYFIYGIARAWALLKAS
jgi:GT2 family glycosyltransferase